MFKTGLECQSIPKKKKSTKSLDSTWISSNKCRHCFAQPSMVRLFFVLSGPILFFFLAVAWRILVSWPEMEPAPSALESWRLDHWTTREAPELPYFTGGGSRVFFTYSQLYMLQSRAWASLTHCFLGRPFLSPYHDAREPRTTYKVEKWGSHSPSLGPTTTCLRKVTWGTWVHRISWWPKPRNTFFFQPFSRGCLFFGSQIRLLYKTFYF